jgi:hypothetical protein
MRANPASVHLALALATVAVAGCGGGKSDDKAGDKAGAKTAGNTCKDVEAAMRRLAPERTRDLKAGAFEQTCKAKGYDQARIDCMVAAKVMADLTYCADPTKPRPTPAGTTDALVTKSLPGLKVKLTAPDRATIEERDTDAHLTDGTFKLNLSVVDGYSVPDAPAMAASLKKEPGFLAFTREDAAGKTWRYEYTLDGGKAGVSMRLDLAGRALDCTIHGVAPEVATAVAAACATVAPL